MTGEIKNTMKTTLNGTGNLYCITNEIFEIILFLQLICVKNAIFTTAQKLKHETYLTQLVNINNIFRKVNYFRC